MADFSSWIMPVVRGGSAGKKASSSAVSGNKNWDSAGRMDQITVVRIDDTHISGETSHVRGKGKSAAECYEVEHMIPAEEEVVVVEEEEDDSIYVIEYSNPEEDGESYQFTMSVDQSLPPKKLMLKRPAMRENADAAGPMMSHLSRPPRPRLQVRQQRKLLAEEEVKRQAVVSNKCVLELGEDRGDVMKMNSDSGEGQLRCTLCPPPGRFFRRAAGLAVHLKHMHYLEENKIFFCTSCKQKVRTQIQLDAHTRRHAKGSAVFTCLLCSSQTENKEETKDKVEVKGYKGSKLGLKRHLEKEHPGIIPRCNICNKGFSSLGSYLADQFRHVGVSPYYCDMCQIYEMTQRGLRVHIKNHYKKQKLQPPAEAHLQTPAEAHLQPPAEAHLQTPAEAHLQTPAEAHLQTTGVATSADNSATDDSDF